MIDETLVGFNYFLIRVTSEGDSQWEIFLEHKWLSGMNNQRQRNQSDIIKTLSQFIREN